MKKEVEKLLQYVQKPARYIGGELNAVVKDKEKVDIRYAFCFPDTYEIGMSHLGMKILYGLVNDRDDSWCERVFAPDNDMEEQLRKNNVPLFALENETRYNVHKLSPVTPGRKENPNEKEYPDKTVFPNRRLYPVVHNIPLYTKEQQANLSSLSFFVL